ncbi:bifunctional hydroxymethylpyrimidine kinase/phosphomethylpyrimidine kinase [Chelativorans petroleitrophicus]|nr:bifunctional hydroxymethylpyrimidine kinase/phosphomethylpyrimidine kinase [Chelativorans petroleitrophicus]
MAVNPSAHVLVVAGSDSSGGAGIARDVETIAAFGLRSSLTVTAVTVQTHDAVTQIEPMPPTLVVAQIHAAIEANAVRAVKVGMLPNPAITEAVASVLADNPLVPVVLDPVLAASSGASLTAEGAAAALKRRLLPLCRLVTPNLPELALLADTPPARNEDEAVRQAGFLLEAGAQAVLVKGGHAAGERSDDLLIRPGRPPARFAAPRLPGSVRGTGCMLSSAIAANLARNATLEESVQNAKRYVFEQIRLFLPDRQTAATIG